MQSYRLCGSFYPPIQQELCNPKLARGYLKCPKCPLHNQKNTTQNTLYPAQKHKTNKTTNNKKNNHKTTKQNNHKTKQTNTKKTPKTPQPNKKQIRPELAYTTTAGLLTKTLTTKQKTKTTHQTDIKTKPKQPTTNKTNAQ